MHTFQIMIGFCRPNIIWLSHGRVDGHAHTDTDGRARGVVGFVGDWCPRGSLWLGHTDLNVNRWAEAALVVYAKTC